MTEIPPLSILDTLRPEVQPHIYEHYDEIRSASGVFRDKQLRAWLVTERDLVMGALTDKDLSSVRYADLDAVDEQIRPLFATLGKQLFYLDAPDHPRIRTLMNRSFSPKTVAAMRAQIERTTDSLLDAVNSQSSIDILADLAYPLPVSVICDLLDVPPEQRAQVKRWSSAVAIVMGKAKPSPEELSDGVQAMSSMLDYLGELLLQQRQNATSVVFEAFLGSSDVSDDEILANAAALLLVGHETTTNLISNGMLALLQHPEQLALLRERPELIKPAVEELLRYDSSVQNLLRRSINGTTIGDQEITAGSTVLLVLGAANRDPKAYADPHVLDIQRDGPRHVAFGHGVHACIGASLARLEAEIVLPKLLERYEHLHLTDEPLQWHASLTFRGLHSLPVDTVSR